MKSTTLIALASSLAPASAYLVTGDPLNCRSGPGTSYAVKKTYPKDKDISITCQTAGMNVNGNVIWDKTSDGCYVSDYYVKTGSSGYVADKCGSTTTCVAPSSNQATVDLIAEFEGFVDHVYIDDTGNPTVGYGHLCNDAKCSGVKYPIPLSDTAGKKLLADDMKIFEKCITTLLTPNKVTLNANQYGALVSWAFNMGCPAVETSTLVARLKAGTDLVNTVLAEELPRWVHAAGVVFPGLVRRRNAEVALARQGTEKGALPVDC